MLSTGKEGDPRPGLVFLVRAVAGPLLAGRFGSTRLLHVVSERYESVLEDLVDLIVPLRGQYLRRTQKLLVHVRGHLLASHRVNLPACQQDCPKGKPWQRRFVTERQRKSKAGYPTIPARSTRRDAGGNGLHL